MTPLPRSPPFQKALRRLYDSKVLLLMFLPGLLYYVIFRYAPMYGVIVAFKKYNIMKGIWGSTWVGLRYFHQFFNDMFAGRLIRNTVLLSVFDLICSFPVPILLALLLNELRNRRFKKLVQTSIYLPHFISQVVVIGLMVNILSPSNGIVNKISQALGGTPIYFMAEAGWFRPLYIISNIWKESGWGAILYIAALVGINPELYEAAYSEGANRFQRILHISLPGILPTLSIMLILRMGSMLSVGYEKIILMYSSATYETADVLSTYVYRQGLGNLNYSYAAAVDLMNNIINLVLLVAANRISRSVSENSLW